MSLSTLTGTAGLALGVAAGLLFGVMTTYIAWTWRGNTVRDLQAEVAEWTRVAGEANRKAEEERTTRQVAMDRMMDMLVENQQFYEGQLDEFNRQLKDVATTTRRALNSATVRLLNTDPGRAGPAASQDPRPVPGPAARPATPPGGPAADDGSGASEYEVSRWINYARCATVRRNEVLGLLQGAIKAAPQCFEIVDDGGPDYWSETARICAR